MLSRPCVCLEAIANFKTRASLRRSVVPPTWPRDSSTLKQNKKQKTNKKYAAGAGTRGSSLSFTYTGEPPESCLTWPFGAREGAFQYGGLQHGQAASPLTPAPRARESVRRLILRILRALAVVNQKTSVDTVYRRGAPYVLTPCCVCVCLEVSADIGRRVLLF